MNRIVGGFDTRWDIFQPGARKCGLVIDDQWSCNGRLSVQPNGMVTQRPALDIGSESPWSAQVRRHPHEPMRRPVSVRHSPARSAWGPCNLLLICRSPQTNFGYDQKLAAGSGNHRVVQMSVDWAGLRQMLNSLQVVCSSNTHTHIHTRTQCRQSILFILELASSTCQLKNKSHTQVIDLYWNWYCWMKLDLFDRVCCILNTVVKPVW